MSERSKMTGQKHNEQCGEEICQSGRLAKLTQEVACKACGDRTGEAQSPGHRDRLLSQVMVQAPGSTASLPTKRRRDHLATISCEGLREPEISLSSAFPRIPASIVPTCHVRWMRNFSLRSPIECPKDVISRIPNRQIAWQYLQYLSNEAAQ